MAIFDRWRYRYQPNPWGAVGPPGWYQSPLNGQVIPWYWDGEAWHDPHDELEELFKPLAERMFIQGVRHGLAMAEAQLGNLSKV